MLDRQKFEIKKTLGLEFSTLGRMLIEIENLGELRKLFDWENEPCLAESGPDVLDHPEGLDLRRLHDAEVMETVRANLGGVDAALIEGCRDAESVYRETCVRLSSAEPGSYLLWRDFDLALARSYHGIYEVCVALEELYRTRQLRGGIVHLRDSWVGLYRVQPAD